MWNDILTHELGIYMAKVTGHTEDDQTVYNFFQFIQQRADSKIVKALAKQWKSYDGKEQLNLAVKYAGIYHTSRFLIMMEYLSSKAEKGEL